MEELTKCHLSNQSDYFHNPMLKCVCSLIFAFAPNKLCLWNIYFNFSYHFLFRIPDQKCPVILFMSRWLVCSSIRKPRSANFLKRLNCKSVWKTTIHKRISVSPARSSMFSPAYEHCFIDGTLSHFAGKCTLKQWSIFRKPLPWRDLHSGSF